MKNKDQNENLKTFLVMPMRWELKNAFKDVWNKDDDRIFPPKHFGIGWTMNFHAVARKAGLIKKS